VTFFRNEGPAERKALESPVAADHTRRDSRPTAGLFMDDWLNSDSVLEDSLKLASVAHDDRERVRAIAIEALDHFDSTQDAQQATLEKRLTQNRKPTKLVLAGPALLHRLILKMSEQSAADEENDASLVVSDTLLHARYLQLLLFIALTRSSRWTAIAICQFVYAYPGSTIQRAVQLLRNEHFDDRKRQSIKRDIAKLLSDRFTGLSEQEGPGGEKYFAAHPDQSSCYPFVVTHLTALAPWEPDRFGVVKELDQALAADWDELARCRRLIVPTLFERVIGELGLTPPSNNLRFPRMRQ
jgi:hypothetical protein